MKITVFTSNHTRHISLINKLGSIADQLFIIQESRSIFPGLNKSRYYKSNILHNYFQNVNRAQEFFFKDKNIFTKKNIFLLPLALGDLSHLNLKDLTKFLKSDLYIVFGSSYIKNDLCDFLINNNAINIHMGISPYYRGTDCNFWALNDKNYHLVGATVHLLSKGLDNGDILYHALPKYFEDPFLFTMSSVVSAIESLIERIKDKSIFKFETIKQDKKLEINYTKIKEFNEKVVESFTKSNLKIKKIDYDIGLFYKPYFL